MCLYNEIKYNKIYFSSYVFFLDVVYTLFLRGLLVVQWRCAIACSRLLGAAAIASVVVVVVYNALLAVRNLVYVCVCVYIKCRGMVSGHPVVSSPFFNRDSSIAVTMNTRAVDTAISAGERSLSLSLFSSIAKVSLSVEQTSPRRRWSTSH